MLPGPVQTSQSRIHDLHASGNRPNSTKLNVNFRRIRNLAKQASRHPGWQGRQADFGLELEENLHFPEILRAGSIFLQKNIERGVVLSMDDGEACVILSFFRCLLQNPSEGSILGLPSGHIENIKKMHSNE